VIKDDSLLDAIEIETRAEPDASIIWMHGLGDDGNGWSMVVDALGLPVNARIRFIFPHAPMMPITINNGFVMRAWYDIAEKDKNGDGDITGVCASQKRIEALITREIERGIKTTRMVLAGFSQGGVIALHTGLRYPQSFAGIVALSTYLMDAENLPRRASAANRATPVFMAHGNSDTVVLPKWAMASRDFLKTNGYQVEWRDYPMGHSATDEELCDVGVFLNRVLPLCGDS
jgi:phospholipase/carboxylesterase